MTQPALLHASRRHWPVLAALLFLAASMRIAHVQQPFCMSRDGVRFVEFAQKFTSDPVRWMRIETKQPGYPLLLAGIHRATGGSNASSPLRWEQTGRWLSAISGMLVVVLLYLLALRLFNATVAAVSGIFAALWPDGVQLSAAVLSDMPHLVLYLAAILLGWRGIVRLHIGWSIAAGIIAGAAYLVRQEAIGLVPAFAFAAWRCDATAPPKRRALLAVAFAAAFVVAAAPHSIAVGRAMPNKNPVDFLEQPEQANLTPEDDAPAAPHVSSAPGSVFPVPFSVAAAIPAWQAPGRMAEEWAKSGRYVFATLFLVCLFVRSMPRGERRGRDLLAAAAVAQLVLVQARVSAYGEISGRYLVIPAALSIPWAAAAFVSLAARVAGGIHQPTPGRQAAVWLSAFILALTPLIYYATLPISAGKEHYRRAGLWLAEHAAASDIIVTHPRLEQVMYYAGRTWPRDELWVRTRPEDPWKKAARIVEKKRAAWYVDARGSRRDDTMEQAFLREIERAQRPAMRLEHREAADDGEVFIWRVVPPLAADNAAAAP